MTTEDRGQKSEVRLRASVLECGGPPPLSDSQSARGLAQSKTWRICVASLVFLATGVITHAQSFSIDWHTMDGGGGTSTGGVYSISGTIGQPDAGPVMTGGAFSLQGGFWALPVAVQVTNAPTLTIAPAAAGFALISWTPNTPGFVLQERASLSSGGWANAPSGTNNPATVPATLPAKFYRLHKE